MGTWNEALVQKADDDAVLPAIAAWTAWRAKRSQRSASSQFAGRLRPVARVEVATRRSGCLRLEDARSSRAENGRVPELHVPEASRAPASAASKSCPALPHGDDGRVISQASAASARRETVERKRHSGMRAKFTSWLATDRSGGDEARVAPHEFHEPDPTRHAARLGCARNRAREPLLRPAEKSEVRETKTTSCRWSLARRRPTARGRACALPGRDRSHRAGCRRRRR